MTSSDICGNCTMCCKLLGIREKMPSGELLAKPAGQWCPHCEVAKGCKIYQDRPKTCREFECLYLMGVQRGEITDFDLRPDRCHVVVSPTTDDNLCASVDAHRPDAWRKGKIGALLRKAARAGVRVTISSGPTTRKLVMRNRSDGRLVLEEWVFTPPDENGMQWSVPDSARLVEVVRDQ